MRNVRSAEVLLTNIRYSNCSVAYSHFLIHRLY